MAIFYLKERDVLPVLVAYLKNPDDTAHDLTGKTVRLLIRLSDGTKLIRNMVVDVSDPTTGIVRYTWLATDWDVASGVTVDDANPVGGLVESPGTVGAGGFVLTPGRVEHRMEYETTHASGRLTFPNDSYDVLRIVGDLGQGA